MKNLEIRTITHKDINIVVELDYINGLASLVEIINSGGNIKTRKKEYIFAKRGLKYMDSWLTILEAMSVAVKECKKELEVNFKEPDFKGLVIKNFI